MHNHHKVAVLAVVTTLAACDGASSGGALDTEEQRASYAIGLNVGRTLAPAGERLDMDAFLRGVEDVLQDRDPALEQDSLQAALQRFSQTVQEDQQRERAAAGEANRAEGEAFLAENAQREGVETTESGLQYEVVEAGDGPTPEPGQSVTIHYRGTLIDGTEFDSSHQRGQPATFNVSGVIPGFSEGLQLMPVGSTYKFYIPGDIAYGPQGSGDTIGPNQTLIFEVEMIEIAGG